MTTPVLIRVVRWTTCLILAAGIIAGLAVSGSPATRRLYTLDEKRVNSLSQISYGLDSYVQTHSVLPPSLDQLLPEHPYLTNELRDPSTSIPYEYRSLTTTTYELCATFDLPANNEESNPSMMPATDAWGNQAFAFHDVGHSCYTLRVRTPQPSPAPIEVKAPTRL